MTQLPQEADYVGVVLDSLVQTMKDQLAAARRGELDYVSDHMATLDDDMAHVSQMSADTLAAYADQIQEIQALWKRLQLVLAGQQDAVKRQKDKLQGGKHAAKAYSWAGGAGIPQRPLGASDLL